MSCRINSDGDDDEDGEIIKESLGTFEEIQLQTCFWINTKKKTGGDYFSRMEGVSSKTVYTIQGLSLIHI